MIIIQWDTPLLGQWSLLSVSKGLGLNLASFFYEGAELPLCSPQLPRYAADVTISAICEHSVVFRIRPINFTPSIALQLDPKSRSRKKLRNNYVVFVYIKHAIKVAFVNTVGHCEVCRYFPLLYLTESCKSGVCSLIRHELLQFPMMRKVSGKRKTGRRKR